MLKFLGMCQIFNKKSDVGIMQICTILQRVDAAFSQILSYRESILWWKFYFRNCQRCIHKFKEQLHLFPVLSNFRHGLCLGWTWVDYQLSGSRHQACVTLQVNQNQRDTSLPILMLLLSSSSFHPRSNTTTNSWVWTQAYCTHLIWGSKLQSNDSDEESRWVVLIITSGWDQCMEI